MVILGLTGSIGMGKTTAARVFRDLGVPVYDADGAVHDLLAAGGAAVAGVEAAFPDVVQGGAVDRQALGRRVFDDPAALARLEAILHPMVRRRQVRFLQAASRRGCRLVVLDVPLLLETGGDGRCDGVVVVSAPTAVQRQRVLRRPGMTAARFDSILARQMPDAEKRRRADFVVATGLGRRFSLRSISDIVRVAETWRGSHWPPHWAPSRRRRRPRRGRVPVQRQAVPGHRRDDSGA
jgi:dephospho-CoA kinase